MKPTKEQVKLVNILIREAIDHGGDAGGPYFENGDRLYTAMILYRDQVFEGDSGVFICWDKYGYPYFESIEEEAVGQHKEME